MNLLPPLNRAYALVLQEEKQREIAKSLHYSDGMALAVNCPFSRPHFDSNGHGQGCGKGKERTCDHCRNLGLPRHGHSIDRCYRLHGYPLGHRLHKPKNESITKGVLGAKPSSHNANKDDSTSVAPSFNPAQYKQIKALLNEGTPQSLANVAGICFSSSISATSFSCFSTLLNSSWIIDTGATDHMISSSNFLTTCAPLVDPIPIRLPNGDSVHVSSSSSIDLTPALHLDNVFHVPAFNVNLMSISKLTQSLRCSVIFFPDFCVFQDLATRKMIGLGKEIGGLYLFKPPTSHPIKAFLAHNKVSP